MKSQSRAEHWDFLTDLLDTGEIDCAEFRLQASDDGYAQAKIDEAIKAREDVLTAARAIAEKGFGRPWDDFLETNAHDTDQSDLINYARAALEARS
jgi:hypothetical protein